MESATLTFNNVEMAKTFAIAWGRRTLCGCDMSRVKSDGSVSVKVYDVDSKKKEFIDNYIKTINS
tara:strand:- start:119 stop:313 length:195 start_codon:yes stop_codon:yes gene_type:complete